MISSITYSGGMMALSTARVGFKALTLLGFLMSWGFMCHADVLDDTEFASLQADALKSFREGITPFVKTYCTDCHGQERQKGGVNFLPALKNPGETASVKLWKQGLASVKTHDMPPGKAQKQPTEEDRQRFLASIAKIKFLSPKDPGAFVIRRLTKVEYGNTLHDLLGVDPSVAHALPDEVIGEGYLNTMSPLQSEQYLEIANEVLDRILPPGHATPAPIRKRLFGPLPKKGTEPRQSARAAAKRMARSAYRRPATDSEVDVLLRVFDLAQTNRLSYDESLRLMLKAVLISPQFLFITPAGGLDSTNDIVRLDDHQLASRLSYLLWATMPDAELSTLADQGRLHQPEVLRSQVKRLLKDSRSRALFDGFGAQWLRLGNLSSKTFDLAQYPQMTPETRLAMYDEARLFFNSIIQENREVVDFVTADYTFLNGRLAELYGLEKQVSGTGMRKVHLANPNRGGILGMPGVLATTSFPNRTSPVKRGVWVLEQVLGEEVPPPPPNVPALEKQDPKAVTDLTLRQRTELHRKDAVCANCHKLLDPIGFGLENFDAIGRWRDRDSMGGAIDAGGELPGGKHFESPRELKAILASRKEDLSRNLTEKLLSYALCRPLEGYDHLVVDQLMKSIARDGYRMQSHLLEIVTSYPFTHRRLRESKPTSTHAK